MNFKDVIKECKGFLEFCIPFGIVLLVFLGGSTLVFLGISYAFDCDAAVSRWERAEESCRESGGHWRSNPKEEICDGAVMLVPHGECWDSVSVDLNVGGRP